MMLVIEITCNDLERNGTYDFSCTFAPNQKTKLASASFPVTTAG
jgi:hypothetical protein